MIIINLKKKVLGLVFSFITLVFLLGSIYNLLVELNVLFFTIQFFLAVIFGMIAIGIAVKDARGVEV